MPLRRNVRRRIEFEALERRETPSAGLGGAIPDVVRRTHSKSIALSGNGTATYTTLTTGTVTLTLNGLGTFNGTITAGSTSASVVLTSGVNQLDLTISGNPPKGRGKLQHFQGTFGVDAGTINGANVTGGKGHITGTLNNVTHTLSFRIYHAALTE